MTPRRRRGYDWQGRIEQFVDLRGEAARTAERLGTVAGRDLAEQHRALTEGAWYVLELARQRPELTTAQVRRVGEAQLTRWRTSATFGDRERWAAADWALWIHEGRDASRREQARRARSPGPEPADDGAPGGRTGGDDRTGGDGSADGDGGTEGIGWS